MAAIETAKRIIPNVLTASRPAIGAVAAEQALHSHWVMSTVLFALAWATDAEGNLARLWHTESQLGALADPVADSALRIEMAVALGAQMHLTLGILAGLSEASVYALNTQVQKGVLHGSRPKIPHIAKGGAVGQALGGGIMTLGLARGNTPLVEAGQTIVTGSTAARAATYGKIFIDSKRHEKGNDHRRTERLPRRQ
jgi:cardiolipin synthase